MRDSPLFVPAACNFIRRYASQLGTNALIKLMGIAVALVDKDNQRCYDVIELVQSYLIAGKATIIGPVSELIEGSPTKSMPKEIREQQIFAVPPNSYPWNSSSVSINWVLNNLSFYSKIRYESDEDWPPLNIDKLTLNQRRVLSLIDCAAELNPKINERPDVFEELNPNSFNNLKPIIEDTSMYVLFRRNALDLYIRKMEEKSKGYVSDFTWDKDLYRIVFSFIAKYEELEQFTESVMTNDLPTEFKRSILTQIAKSKQ